MTEATTDPTAETRTVQQFRHEARRVLTAARQSLALRTEATHRLYSLLNGPIEEALSGRAGLTQDQQVENLATALAKVHQNRAEVAAATEAAKSEVVAAMETWDFDAALAEAAAILTAARQFAADRDFEAHQETKHRLDGAEMPADEPEEDSSF